MPVTLDPNALTTLENAKEYLKIPAADTTKDDSLKNFINRSLGIIEQYCGRFFKARNVTEYHDGDGTEIILTAEMPINSVAELNVDGTRAFLAATQIAAADFVIKSKPGVIELLRGGDFETGAVFSRGQQNIKVTYNAGYAAIPQDVEMACLIHVAYLYNRSGLDGHTSISLGGLAKSFSTAPFPDEARMYLEPYRKRTV